MKRNKFKRALQHLNKKHVVESAPTNNTLGVFSVSPSGVGPVGWTDREFTTDISGNPLLTGVAADFSAGENPQNFDEARDTSGLFEDDGVTLKTLSPPGDNSYILGPFASMWYAWGNFTTLGYIQEGTRRMVNLGAIIGKLSDWDETTFNSYGQLTLEQAIWFKNVKKFGGIDNDPANHNYRAFYPGPPSNTPDAFGRYLCSIADSRSIRGTETRPGAPDNPTQPGEMSPEDNFSAIMAKIASGDRLSKAEEDFLRSQGLDDFVDGGKTRSPMSELAILGISIAAMKALLPVVAVGGKNSLKLAKELGKWWNKGRNIRVANENNASWWKLIKDDVAQIGKTKGGKGHAIPRNWSDFKEIMQGDGGIIWSFTKGFKTGPTPLARQAFERLSKLFALERMTTPPAGNKENKFELPSNDNKNNTGNTKASGPKVSFTAPEAKISLDISNIEVRLSADAATNVNRSQSEINADKQELKVLKARAKEMEKQREALNKRRASGEKVDDSEYKNIGQDLVAGAGGSPGQPYTPPKEDPNNPYVPAPGRDTKIAATYPKKDVWDKMIDALDKGKFKYKPGDPNYVPPGRGMGDRWKVKNNKKKSVSMVAHYQPKRKVLTEIRKPTILPEEKKKFKVKPRVLGHPSNKTLSDQMKDTTPNVAFKKELPVWSMNQKMRNARLSQAKKNDVLEYLGSSGDHWEYMTKTIKEHNKKIINLNYGGKKKVTRKEQVDKDTLVFMEDEDGNKSNILQSKINEMQAETGDKEMFAKYYEMYPQKKRSLFKEVVKRGVFDYPKKPSKKGYPDKEPAKLDPNTGMHPEYGKKYKYDKLDPQSAESMPTQGNPEIDANIAKNLNPESKKRKTKILNQPNG